MRHKQIKLGTGIFLLVLGLTSMQAQTVKDIEGNVYKTVKIGNQEWMAENLKTTKYNDSTAIPLVTDSLKWAVLATPAYCWYKNNEVSYKNTYGALYNWYVIENGVVCPTGWHVPTDDEWRTLADYLGGDAGKLKETGTAHWYSPNSEATNESGFTALPGGSRISSYSNIGVNGYWWSATEKSPGYAWVWSLHFGSSNINRGYNYKPIGSSVRCTKD